MENKLTWAVLLAKGGVGRVTAVDSAVDYPCKPRQEKWDESRAGRPRRSSAIVSGGGNVGVLSIY